MPARGYLSPRPRSVGGVGVEDEAKGVVLCLELKISALHASRRGEPMCPVGKKVV